ncbi:hypothetical protein B0H14DRAFT_2719309, partial [Mycena olivaceomarginata]
SNLSLPSTPSTGSTRSKRSLWSDDEESSNVDVFLYPPGNLLVDKTGCIIEFPDRFQYLFGKTMLLSTLHHFYDIHGTKTHLCLFFNLSDISVDSARISILAHLTSQIGAYAQELELSNPAHYLEDEEDLERKFAKVDRVKAHNHTLFVGVDNYDAPSRTLTRCARVGPSFITEDFPTAREIESLLDSCFWRPLMAATDVIHKNVSTPDAVPSLEGACGFTEEEALYFMRSLLDETRDVTDLRRSCGYYDFSLQNVGVGTAQPLLHPRLLINRIFELSLPQTFVDKDSFGLLSDLLETLPEESDVSGAITVDDLVGLLATGAVDIDGKSASPFDLHATKAVNWSALHSAGALTYDRHPPRRLFHDAWYKFSIPEDPQSFLELLLTVFRDLAQRCFGRKHEPNLRGIFELIMRNPRCIQNGRSVDPIVLLPVEDTCIQVPGYQCGKIFALELKTLTLRGMWQAAHPNDDEPTVEALKALHEELMNLPEDDLLARPYAEWSPALNAMETVLVGSFLLSELPESPQFLAVGGARILLRRRPREKGR